MYLIENMQIILAGNPNSGKTSIFNELTGLNHKVGNFPGVTIDKKQGSLKFADDSKATVIDLPGTYSLYPKSRDEIVSVQTILDFDTTAKQADRVVVVVVDASNIKRSSYYCSQILELGLPTIVALTLNDVAKKKGKEIDVDILSATLGIPVVAVNPRTKSGLNTLKAKIQEIDKTKSAPSLHYFDLSAEELTFIELSLSQLKLSTTTNPYHDLQLIYQHGLDIHDGTIDKIYLNGILSREVTERYLHIDAFLESATLYKPTAKELLRDATRKIDKVLLHPLWGTIILFAVLLLVFQSVFWLASFPMDWIDGSFAEMSSWLSGTLPDVWWADLLINGVIAGIGGVVIFVPQIAILFFLITILEDTGYMSRISFLMDRLFQSAGLSGKSVMPLISGMACAIPAVMAARTIENRKQRMLTILVTPFMSCTARLPVYAILISLVIPEEYYLGFIGLQGLVLMGMYLLGFVTALFAARILSFFMYKREKSFFIQELPVYQHPRWKNALVNMLEKSKVFLFNAGKIILIISIGLWFLSSVGPSSRVDPIESQFELLAAQQNDTLTPEQNIAKSSLLLENSYIGIMGKSIEPVIAPMGFDWKIGIALLTSFAAREVFVGTMATIYSMEDPGDDPTPLKEKLKAAKRSDGTPVYTLATGLALMIFYAFAMQCMATVATVKREAGGWGMALFQLAFMTGLAFVAAVVVYQVLK